MQSHHSFSSLFLKGYLLYFITILVGIWVIHISIYLAVPFTSHEGTHYALLYSGYYVTLCILSMLTTAYVLTRLNRKWRSSDCTRALNFLSVPYLLPTLTTLSVIGVGLHLYDKVVINHFDYTSCFSVAREAWLQSGAQRGYSISSWQSALGHILSHFSFVTIAILMLRGDRVKLIPRIAYTAMAIIVVVIYAGAIGSRSTVLFFFYTCFLAGVLRGMLLPGECWKSLRESVGIFVLVGTTSLIFAGSIFVGRINCGSGDKIAQGLLSKEAATWLYTEEYLDDLEIKRRMGEHPEESEESEESYVDRAFSGIRWWMLTRCGVCSLIGMYLTHGLWNFEHALRAASHPGTSFWGFWIYVRGKLGWGDRAKDKSPRAYPRGMIALPGATWYDFGTSGMLGIALLHGAIIALVGILIQFGGLFTAMGVVGFFSIGLITLWSPLAFAANVMSFPFIGFAFFVTFLFLGVGNVCMERGWNGR